MQSKTAYSTLADWFEYLNDDCDYENWSQYLIMKLRPYSFNKGVDLGCGSGAFTRLFQKAGYEMVGVDSSEAMLTKAESIPASGKRIRYYLAGVSSFSCVEKFDFATAINDVINYIPKNKLVPTFKNVAKLLKKDGIFLFDVSSKKKFEEKIANTVSVDDREDITYLSFNTLENDVATLDVSLFIRQADGTYLRKDEKHTQYVYTEDEIVSALENVGFSVLESTGHLGQDKTVSDRICFTAKKG